MRAWLVVVPLAAFLLSGCSDSKPSTGVASGPGEITELQSVDTLRAAFDDGDGKPRLLLLLSPT